MTQTRVILSICLIAFFSNLYAQEEIYISQEEIVEKVQVNNVSQKILKQEFLMSKAAYQQTNAVFLPNIEASYTGLVTTNPLMAFGSKLNQEIIQLSDFDPEALNNPSKTTNYATILRFEQPLINMDGIYQRKAAKYVMKSNALQLQRKSDYLNLEAKRAYQELQLSYKAYHVLQQTLKAAAANYTVGNNFYNQGLIQKADLLLLEIHLTEIKNEIQKAKSNIKNASNYISFITNTSNSGLYKPNENLTIENIDDSNSTEKRLLENRADIKAMQIASQAAETQFKADKVSFLPRLNAFGSYELYDNKIFNAGANGYIIGAQLSWNIFQGSKRIGKTQKSKAEFEKSKLEYKQYLSQSQLELNKAKRAFLDAKNKLELTTLTLEQSEESLRIRTNRFKEGLEKTSDLLLAETQYAQKQLEYYQTIFQYNYAQAYVQFLTKE